MTGSAAAPPHRLVRERPGLYAVVAAASLLLSLWAIYLDPVINSDGVNDVRAAQYFRGAEWRAGIEMAGEPVYAALAAAVSRVSGMSAAYSLYGLNAGLYAVLGVGFVALASVLGGGRRTPLLAAVLVLLFPALNGFRSYISSDAGYWAFYVWSLAYFMHYAAARDRRSLAGWALAGLAALLFAVEGLVFLLVVPLWLLVHERSGGYGRVLKMLVIAAAGAVLLAYALWEQEWHSHVPVGRLVLHPVDHLAEGWYEMGRGLRFKLEALRGDFLDRYSRGYDDAALAATLLVMCAAGLVKGLGVVYTILAAWALGVSRRILEPGQRYWWAVFAVVSASLLLVPALVEFAVSARDAMTAALTILATVPPALARLSRKRRDATGFGRWLLPLALALVVASGTAGLDLRSQRYHLREAGLWLRANVPAGSSLYSNSRTLVYYSGLYGYRPWADYSWQEAMAMVLHDRWRNFRYLALVIGAEDAHRESILMRKLDIEPVKTVTSARGDRVLIFDTRR